MLLLYFCWVFIFEAHESPRRIPLGDGLGTALLLEETTENNNDQEEVASLERVSGCAFAWRRLIMCDLLAKQCTVLLIGFALHE